MTRIRRIAAVAVLVASLGTLPAAAGPMGTHTANPRFHCIAAVTKLGHRIRVTFKMRSENAHQGWHVRLWDNGIRFFSKDRYTNAQGRFVVIGGTRNRTGPDHVEARAVALRSGKTCSVPVDI
jgi:hypothetical protein